MKKNEKLMIGILVLITIIVIIFANTRNKEKETTVPPVEVNEVIDQVENKAQGEFTQDLGNGTSVNTSDKLSSVKKYNGLEISNIQLSKKGNTTQIVATVKNTTNGTIPFQMLKIKLVDKNNNEIKTVSCAVKELTAGESTQLSTSASFDYVNAYDFVISK